MRGSQVQSRHRNIFCKNSQSAEQFRNVQLGSVYLESNPLRANSQVICLPWNAPRGSVAVIKNSPHAISDETGVVIMDAGPINGFDLNPFEPTQLAVACEDGSVALFSVPADGLDDNLDEPTATMDEGHEKRALGVQYHPWVSNLLASHSGGKDVKLWDVSQGSEVYGTKLGGLNTSIDFDSASTMVTFAKDRALSLFDLRAGSEPTTVVNNVHEGNKGGRAVVLSKLDRILCTGFTKSNAREAKLFDPRKAQEPLQTLQIDANSSSSPFSLYDEDLSIVYIWGKGDGNIRCYEATENALIEATEFKSNLPQSGLVLMPKQDGINVAEGQIDLLLKLTPKIIDTLRVLVPRAGGAGFFDNEIWPDTWNGEALGDVSSFFGGENPKDKTTVALEPK